MPETDHSTPLGLIAGGGDLPQTVVDSCRKTERPVVVAMIEGSGARVDNVMAKTSVGIGELGAVMDFFRAHNVTEVCFGGHVSRPNFKTLKVDSRGAKALPRVMAAAMRGDDSLLRAVLRTFENDGFDIVGAEEVSSNTLLPIGVFAGPKPKTDELKDVFKGITIASTLGAMDIGQGCVVTRGLVMAAEAQEGTDRMLARVGNLPAKGGVLVKWPKPVQDRRIDLPTIGPSTIEGAARAGLVGVAGEADATLMMKPDAMKAIAEKHGIFVLGLKPHATSGAKPK